MSIRIPKNQIQQKYTIGKEYMYKNTYKEYQGHYYILNNKTFAGSYFNVHSPELIKIKLKEIETLQKNPELEKYINLTDFKSATFLLNNFIPPPLEDTLGNLPENDSDYNAYFYKKTLDDKSILIKEISKETFIRFQNNPAYQTISVKVNLGDAGISVDEINRAEKEMPGFATWFLYNRAI